MCPHELAVLTSGIFFQQSRTGIEEELLDIFMAQEKSRLDNEQTALRKVKMPVCQDETRFILQYLQILFKNKYLSEKLNVNILRYPTIASQKNGAH